MTIDKIIDKREDTFENGGSVSGQVFGNVSNASTIYNQQSNTGKNRFAANPGYTGYMAEQANHLYDVATFKNAKLVGYDNAKNGADRIVNGVEIQSKYCNSGLGCVAQCFDDNGFRYFNSQGQPMQIEVPSDMYEAAVKAMEEKIKQGRVKGVTDPAEAKNIIRKGHFTYEQVKNMARFGTIESLAFDAVNGVIVASCAFGVSSAMSFAVSMWEGKPFEESIKSAAASGIKVSGVTFVTSVLAGQLTKAGLNSALVSSSETIVRVMGPKTAALIANAFRSGANIYGAAAMKSVAKILRSNFITATASFVVLSVGDVADIFRGRISGEQLFKNLVKTGSTIAGGTGGWLGGAAAGAWVGSVIPFIGTAFGGFIGGLLGAFGGGVAADKLSTAIMDEFIEDDAKAMVRIIQSQFQKLASEFLLTEDEATSVVNNLQAELTGDTLKDMFESDNRKRFAHNLLIGHVEHEAASRQYVEIPSNEDMAKGVENVLEAVEVEFEKDAYQVCA